MVRKPIKKKSNEVQNGVAPKLSNTQGASLNAENVGKAVVGMSKGVTLNMGDFNSARIDVYIQRTVEDDSEVIEETLQELDAVLTEEIERQVEELEE